MDISPNQMANIRLIILTHHLYQIPFDIIKIDDYWFVDKIFHPDLSYYLKEGDRLLVSFFLFSFNKYLNKYKDYK